MLNLLANLNLRLRDLTRLQLRDQIVAIRESKNSKFTSTSVKKTLVDKNTKTKTKTKKNEKKRKHFLLLKKIQNQNLNIQSNNLKILFIHRVVSKKILV